MDLGKGDLFLKILARDGERVVAARDMHGAAPKERPGDDAQIGRPFPEARDLDRGLRLGAMIFIFRQEPGIEFASEVEAIAFAEPQDEIVSEPKIVLHSPLTGGLRGEHQTDLDNARVAVAVLSEMLLAAVPRSIGAYLHARESVPVRFVKTEILEFDVEGTLEDALAILL